MGDDILEKVGISSNVINLHLNEDDIENYILYELEILLNSNSRSSSLSEYGLPMPRSRLLSELKNRLLMEEKNYDRVLLAKEHETSVSKLNNDQKAVYDSVMKAYSENTQELISVYGQGGTGKTFLWSTIISAIRSVGKIVLAVASSGIASLLLPSRRTTHSRFKIPLDLTNDSVCDIKKNTQLSYRLLQTDLIVWDEAPMIDRKCVESLDRTLGDILDEPTKPFGGKSVLLGGDFRQTLPVKTKGTRMDIIASSIVESPIWKHFKIYTLSQNMRLLSSYVTDTEKHEIPEFSTWLLQIGDGCIGVSDENDPIDTKWVKIPKKYLIPDDDNALTKLFDFIYTPDVLKNPTACILRDGAIICPKNENTSEINKLILDLLPGPPTVYQ